MLTIAPLALLGNIVSFGGIFKGHPPRSFKGERGLRSLLGVDWVNAIQQLLACLRQTDSMEGA